MKIKWHGGPGDLDVNTWNGIAFPRGEFVEVEDPSMIKTAKRNRFYEVEGEKDDVKAAKAKERGAASKPAKRDR